MWRGVRHLALLLGALQAWPALGAVLFRADLTPDQVVPKNGAPSPAGVSRAWATATLLLDLDSPVISLQYEIVFHGLDLASDVQAIHLHLGQPSLVRHVGSDVNGPHALNIYGLPREDDADLVLDFSGNRLSGIWDNLDLNYGPDGVYDPGDSLALGSAVPELFEGHLYFQVHTFDYPLPDTGELRGQVYQVPEPSRTSLLIVGVLIGMGWRRRHG